MKKTKKKSYVGKIIGFIITLIIIFCGVGALMYFTDNFPELNAKVESVFTALNTELPDSTEEPETQNSIETEVEAQIELPYVFMLTPVFSGQLFGAEDFLSTENVIATDKALAEWKIRNFDYISDYLRLTNVSQTGDCFLFMDSEPALVCINKETGEVKKTLCSVFPGTQGYVKESDYLFIGRDTQQYLFSFDREKSELDTVKSIQKDFEVEEQKTLSYYSNKVSPDKKTEKVILDGLTNWASLDEQKPLPKLQFINANDSDMLYAIDSNLEEFDFNTPSLFVFSPKKQGLYKLGLSDQNGTWLTTRAYVAIFTDGELSLVSLDYKSNKPQIQLQLSNNQLYYIAAGNFIEMDVSDDSAEQRLQKFLHIEAVQ